jgi:GntP family gluconate:H+ symporter
VAIAAVSILDAPWWRVALFGVPVAAVLAVLAAASARWWPAAAPAAQLSIPAPTDAQKHGGGSAAVVLLATILPLLLLIVRSLGDIPSEPFGGGQKRELILGLGSPLALFVAGVGIMAIGQWRSSRALFGDSTWTQHIFGNVAGLLLIVGAAGGLQKLCQETGMAELLGERLLEWHIGPLGGLLIPFLIAALIKTLQGSSLVAAITTAGMVQPLLLPLGVGDESGRALASLAVGIGAMTCSHINDEFFWVATGSAGLSPARGLAMLTVGTLLQGAVAVGALLLLFALASIV